MKLYALTFIALIVCNYSFSQDCSELFISEYVEGSYQNKAIEIYNPTSSAIDLSSYSIDRYKNGNTEITDAFNLSGSIEPYSVWVVTNGSTDTSSTYGYCFPELYNMGDQVGPNSYPTPLHFNGNDAIVLSKNGTIIDLIGKIGEDPGDAWTDDPTAGFTDANNGTWWTMDQTLVRKKEVLQGVTSNPIIFNVTTQWDSLPENTWTELGSHTCDCNQSNNIIEQANRLSFIVFPNPTYSGTIFNISTNNKIENLTLTNLLGQSMFIDYKLNNNKAVIRTEGIPKGLYVVTVTDEHKSSNSSTIIIK